jgi:hypothetical protein
MSALLVAPVRPMTAGRPALRVVHGGGAGRPPASTSLAPATQAQAWRRRVSALLILVSLLALLVIGTTSAVSGRSGPVTVPVAAATVVAVPGQTLWELAVTHAPSGTSTVAYIAAIMDANGLADPVLDAWQVLVLPAS